MPKKNLDYEVGFQKPPKHSQFRKGKSGNPCGRPKNAKNRKTIIRDVLERPIKFREGEQIKSATVLEVILRRLAQNAMQGEPRSTLTTLKLAAEAGFLDETTTQQTPLSPTEEALLGEIINNLKNSEG